jgi:mycobactin salicyl-AMP ligase
VAHQGALGGAEAESRTPRGPARAGGDAAPHMGLASLLAAAAERHPDRPALLDPADKPAWSGRPALTWTFATAREAVGRFAAALRRLDLPPGSPVGLMLAGSSEAALALVATEAAGLLPCLLPIAWDEAQLAAAAEATGLRAVLTQGQIGAARPAETLCRVAAGYFGLRFVAAFGPGLPDGVIGLDQAFLDHRPDALPEVRACGLVTFADGDPRRPVHRGGDALTAAAALHLVAARFAPGERVVSLLPQSDLRGLVTGFAAALLAGAAFESHPLPGGRALAAAVEHPGDLHLVVPDWMEGRLAAVPLPAHLRSLTIARRAPAELPSAAAAQGRILDAVAFGETALVSARREDRDIAAVLAAPERLPGAAGLISLRREPDGRLAFRGPAARTGVLQRGKIPSESEDAWVPSPFRVTVEDGRATAIAPA